MINFVWKHLLKGPSAGKIHCTSTTIASQAPVRTTFSCCKKLPAIGIPRRIATSLEVQHTPEIVIPFAPISFAYATISGLSATSQIISERLGSCPCTTMFTFSSTITPRFASVSIGFGVPNKISENSVPIMEPPHPSESPARIDCFTSASGLEEHPI